MKKITSIIIAILSVSMLLMACQKNARPADERLDLAAVYGRWEIRSTFTMLLPPQSFQPGNGRILEFRKDGNLVHYADNKVVSSTTYKISKYDGSCGNNAWLINYPDKEDNGGNLLSIKKDTLYISGPPCWQDWPEYVYVRIK